MGWTDLRSAELQVGSSPSASLTALVKSVDEGGLAAVRIIRDGTTGVDLNRTLRSAMPATAPLWRTTPMRCGGRPSPLYAEIMLTWSRERSVERRALRLLTRKVFERAVLRVVANTEGRAVAVGRWCPYCDLEGWVVAGKSR